VETASPAKPAPSNAPKSNLDLLLDLDVSDSLSTPVMQTHPGTFLSPMTSTPSSSDSGTQPAQPAYISTRPIELVSSVSSGCGLQIMYRYTRSVHLYSATMVTIELTLINTGSDDLSELKITNKNIPVGISIHEFSAIASLPAGSTKLVTLGVDFGDSTQNISFDIVASGRLVKVELRPTVGELVRPVVCTEGHFMNEQGKLRGMNEHSTTLSSRINSSDIKTISSKLFRAANVASIISTDPQILRFAGQTLSSKALVLITVQLGDKAKLAVCCEKMIIGSILLTELKEAFCYLVTSLVASPSLPLAFFLRLHR